VFAGELFGELRQGRERQDSLAHARRVRSEFVSVARVFGTLAGLFSKYDPDMDFGRFVLPTVGPAFFSAL
jgi:hypothetical protein